MRRACEELLDAICAKGPLLLVLEDLHWGDRPSVAFVDRVLLALRERPLVVVAFARPDVDDVFPDVWRLRPLTRIALAELSRRASERLVRAALGGDVPPETVAFIVDRASGHPFYLEEIIRAFAEGRGDDLPPTVLAMVQARLEGLSDEPRRILRAASVFGQSFWRGSVRALLGADDRTTMGWDWLDELCRSELVTRRPDTRFPGEEELAFRHVLVRAAAYATLTEEDRVLGHRLAGRWLEDHGEPDAVVLAEHFERGGDAPSAIRWYRRAAEQAFEGDDLAAALRLAARAVGCGALGETLGALRVLEAEAHRWRGQQADALAAAVEAMSVSDPGGALWCQAAGEVAMAAGRVGAPQKAAEIARALLDQQQPADATAFALAATRTASILIDDGQHDAAEALLDRIERGLAPEVLADPIVAGRYFFARSVEAGQKGDVAGQLDAARRTIQATDASGDARGGAISRITLARAFLELGAVEEATRALAAATAGAARQGLHHVTLLARCEEGVLDALRGRFDEAVRTERSAVEDFVAQRNLRMEGVARLRLSTILLDKGDAGEASVEAARALELASARDSLRARTLAAVAETDVASGRVEAALAHAREAALLVDELGLVRDAEVVAGLALARALQAAGQAGLARDAALRVEAIVRARASRIADPVLRESFLTQVPENARAIALASEMSRPASANEAPES
jgi:tetratricopeptide (TPR) repeat protein